MKIRLLAIDSKIPNYAIMKISSYWKAKGADVDWFNPLLDSDDADKLYISKIFTFSDDYNYIPKGKCEVIKGGTGYDYRVRLPDEIENITDLDYSLYPNCDYSIIFTTRGCVRNCPFCIVRKKEGLIHNVPIAHLNPRGKWIMLLDNNFFSCPSWRDNGRIIKSFNQPIDFNTGIDLRLLTEEQCLFLHDLKIKRIHCAWDNYADKDAILPKLEMLCKYVKPYKIIVYVLVGFQNREIVSTDEERVMTLKKMGVSPFAMGYMNFEDKNWRKTKSVIDFCRWVDDRYIFKSTSWKDYSDKYSSICRDTDGYTPLF